MRLVKIFFFLVFGVSIVILVILFFVGYFKPPKAGIVVDANRPSLVFLNDEQVGRTKYEGTYSSGEVKLKIVPDSFDKPIPSYEVKIDLVPGVNTMIQRDFGESDETSGGAIISFQKYIGSEAGMAIVSVPDSAQVKIDGQVRDTTPAKIDAISDGEHTISVSTPGYYEKILKIRTYKGYKLVAAFTLVKNYKTESSPTPSPTPEEITKRSGVRILDTPTGFLRVRSEPSSIAREIGQVEPGKVYFFIEQDEATGWIKIEYEESKEGWISSQYARRVEETPTPKPSPTATPLASPSISPKPSPTVKP